MLKGQSPSTTKNYKGRVKGACSAKKRELMPMVRESFLDGYSVAAIAEVTKQPWTTISQWIDSDEECSEFRDQSVRSMAKTVFHQVFTAMGDNLPHMVSMLSHRNPGVALKANRELQNVVEVLARYKREQDAIDSLEERLAAIQSVQAGFGYDSPIAALEPVDVEVAPVESAEMLPMQIEDYEV